MHRKFAYDNIIYPAGESTVCKCLQAPQNIFYQLSAPIIPEAGIGKLRGQRFVHVIYLYKITSTKMNNFVLLLRAFEVQTLYHLDHPVHCLHILGVLLWINSMISGKCQMYW